MASRHSFRDRAEAAAAVGYQGMCLHLRDYAQQRAAGLSDATLRMILADNGLIWNSLEFLLGWDCAPGASAADEDIAWRAAQGLGLSVLNIGSRSGLPAVDLTADRAALAALAGRAAAQGVSVALEIVPWTVARDLPTATGLISGISNAGLVIDSWHVFRGAIALADLARLPGEKILAIQINDAKATPGSDLAAETRARLCCGAGSFDLPGFMAALRLTGTPAPIGVEVISPALAALDVAEAARRSVAGTGPLLGMLRRRISPYGG